MPNLIPTVFLLVSWVISEVGVNIHDLNFCGNFLQDWRVLRDQIQAPVRAPMSRNIKTLTMNTAVLGLVQSVQGSPTGCQPGRLSSSYMKHPIRTAAGMTYIAT